MRLTSIVLLLLLVGPAHARATADQVVLLHGLARTSRSMEPLAEFLREHRLAVHNVDYPSRERGPDELVAYLAKAVRDCCPPEAGRLHFVTHSLGGILVRQLLAEEELPHLGRVVMLAPPNQGSEVIDEWGDWPLFGAVLGPTATELGTAPDSFPNRIGAPRFELGVIAARQSANPIGSLLIPGADDGAVSVERARLEGARDFIVVDATHTFIMRDRTVAEQVLHFLRQGRFATTTP